MDFYDLSAELDNKFADLHIEQEDKSMICIYDEPSGHKLAGYLEFYDEDEKIIFVSFREDVIQELRLQLIAWLAIYANKHDCNIDYHTDFHYNNLGEFVSGKKQIQVESMDAIMSPVTFISEQPIPGYGLGGRQKQNRYNLLFDDGDFDE